LSVLCETDEYGFQVGVFWIVGGTKVLIGYGTSTNCIYKISSREGEVHLTASTTRSLFSIVICVTGLDYFFGGLVLRFRTR